MRNPLFFILLLVLVILDAWLLSHPNLIGQAGVFFFDYDYVATFPKALATVSVASAITLLVTWLIGRLGRVVGAFLLMALFVVSVYWLWDSFMLYNSGVYKLTGAGFRAGARSLDGAEREGVEAGLRAAVAVRPGRRLREMKPRR